MVEERPLPLPPVSSAEVPVESAPNVEVLSATGRSNYRSLQEALTAIPAPAYSEGKETISGHVRTREGAPVAGILIRAAGSSLWKNKNSNGHKPPPARGDLMTQVLKAISEYHWEEATVREALTDENGSYVLTGLRAGERYTLNGDHKNWVVDAAPGHHRHDELPGGIIDFIAEPAVTLQVDVTFPNGTQPHKARIEWRRNAGSAGRGSEEWYPHDPVIRLKPGTYTLTAVAGHSQEFSSEEEEIAIDTDVEPPRLAFVLKTRAGIRGNLVFPAGEEPEQGQVYLLRSSADAPPEVEQLVKAGESRRVYRRSNFEYFFKDLPPGTFLLGAGRTQGQILTEEVVQVAERELVTSNLTIPPLDSRDYVVLWAYGPSGEVLRDVQVSFGSRSRPRWSGQRSVIRRSDGSFWLVLEAKDAAERDGEYYVSVHSQRYGRKQENFSPSGSVEVSVRFEAPAFLQVTVSGYEGSGYEGRLRLSVRAIRDGGSSSRGNLDFQGRQSFGPLERGDYEVLLSLKTERYRYHTVGRVPVTLRAGQNESSVAVPPLYSLVVEVGDLKPGTRIQIRASESGTGWGGSYQTLDETGQMAFEWLPAGEYKISTLGGSSRGEMKVSVPAQMLVRFAPQPLNTMAVTLSDSNGSLAKAGFQTGDLIIGVNGTEFQDHSQMQKVLAGSRGKEEITFLIMRGDAQLEISIDSEKFHSRNKERGGYYRPTIR